MDSADEEDTIFLEEINTSDSDLSKSYVSGINQRLLLKKFSAESFFDIHSSSFKDIFNQLEKDFYRTTIMTDGTPVTSIKNLLIYIHKNLYLKSSLYLVLLFCTQTCMFIPLTIISKRLEENMVIAELKKKDGIKIYIEPYNMSLFKKLKSVKETDVEKTVFFYDITISIDLIIDEVTITVTESI